MQSVKHTFKKEERLKSRKIISELFESGKIIHAQPFKILYNVSEEELTYPAKFAVSVSKKNFKRAVDRNRIKRKIREAYRLNKHLLYSKLNQNNKKLHLFVIYTATKDFHFNEIEKGIKSSIVKLSDRIFKE